MPGKTTLLISSRRTSQREGVVPTDGILPHREKGLDILVEKLVVQTWQRIGTAAHGARDGRVDVPLNTGVQRFGPHCHEVRALLPLDIDDLDELTFLQLIGLCRTASNTPFIHDFAERGRKRQILVLRLRRNHIDPDGRAPTSRNEVPANRRDHEKRRVLNHPKDVGFTRLSRRTKDP